MKQHNNIEYSKGFTLIELLVVVAVLGILAGGILIALNIGGVLGKANITKAKKFAASLERGLVISQVGKWSFEDGSGDAAKDTSGYGNNGDLAGAATTCPGGTACPTWKTATDCTLGFGGCLSFDGNDMVLLNPFSLGNFTVSAWVWSNNWSDNGSITNGEVCGITDDWGVYFTGANGRVRVQIGDNVDNSDTLVDSDSTVPAQSWNHVAVVRSTATTDVKIYINGRLDKTASSPHNRIVGASNPECDVGIYPNSVGIGGHERTLALGGKGLNGLIDEVQIYKEALTLSQIHQLYAQGVIKHMLGYK